jgi:hypothetical protein
MTIIISPQEQQKDPVVRPVTQFEPRLPTPTSASRVVSALSLLLSGSGSTSTASSPIVSSKSLSPTPTVDEYGSWYTTPHLRPLLRGTVVHGKQGTRRINRSPPPGLPSSASPSLSPSLTPSTSPSASPAVSSHHLPRQQEEERLGDGEEEILYDETLNTVQCRQRPSEWERGGSDSEQRDSEEVLPSDAVAMSLDDMDFSLSHHGLRSSDSSSDSDINNNTAMVSSTSSLPRLATPITNQVPTPPPTTGTSSSAITCRDLLLSLWAHAQSTQSVMQPPETVLFPQSLLQQTTATTTVLQSLQCVIDEDLPALSAETDIRSFDELIVRHRDTQQVLLLVRVDCTNDDDKEAKDLHWQLRQKQEEQQQREDCAERYEALLEEEQFYTLDDEEEDEGFDDGCDNDNASDTLALQHVQQQYLAQTQTPPRRSRHCSESSDSTLSSTSSLDRHNHQYNHRQQQQPYNSSLGWERPCDLMVSVRRMASKVWIHVPVCRETTATAARAVTSSSSSQSVSRRESSAAIPIRPLPSSANADANHVKNNTVSNNNSDLNSDNENNHHKNNNNNRSSSRNRTGGVAKSVSVDSLEAYVRKWSDVDFLRENSSEDDDSSLGSSCGVSISRRGSRGERGGEGKDDANSSQSADLSFQDYLSRVNSQSLGDQDNSLDFLPSPTLPTLPVTAAVTPNRDQSPIGGPEKPPSLALPLPPLSTSSSQFSGEEHALDSDRTRSVSTATHRQSSTGSETSRTVSATSLLFPNDKELLMDGTATPVQFRPDRSAKSNHSNSHNSRKLSSDKRKAKDAKKAVTTASDNDIDTSGIASRGDSAINSAEKSSPSQSSRQSPQREESPLPIRRHTYNSAWDSERARVLEREQEIRRLHSLQDEQLLAVEELDEEDLEARERQVALENEQALLALRKNKSRSWTWSKLLGVFSFSNSNNNNKKKESVASVSKYGRNATWDAQYDSEEAQLDFPVTDSRHNLFENLNHNHYHSRNQSHSPQQQPTADSTAAVPLRLSVDIPPSVLWEASDKLVDRVKR